MKYEISIELLNTLRIFDPENLLLAAIYQAAVEHLNLSVSDYTSIRDLTIQGKRDDLHLHLLLIIMFSVISEGSLCIKLTKPSISRRLKIFLFDDADGYAAEIIVKLRSNDLVGIISKKADANSPLVISQNHLYFQKYFILESQLQQHFDRLLALRPSPQEEVKLFNIIKSVLSEVLNASPIVSNGKPLACNNEQIVAIILSVIEDFLIISGGPGTGKTYVITLILRALIRMGYAVNDIAVAAPTGRAAKRLKESIDHGIRNIPNRFPVDEELLNSLQTGTIHRLLQFQPHQNIFHFNDYNKLPIKVLIIDEVSMVDLALMVNLLNAVSEDSKIILVGDKNQLPSVNAGAILAQLIPPYPPSLRPQTQQFLQRLWKIDLQTPKGPLENKIVDLKKSYRSSSGILEFSVAVNRCRTVVEAKTNIRKLPVLRIIPDSLPNWIVAWPAFNTNGNSGCWRLDIEHVKGDYFSKIVQSWAYHTLIVANPGFESSYYEYMDNLKGAKIREIDDDDETLNRSLNKAFAVLVYSRILTVTRQHSRGSQFINWLVAESLRNTFEPHSTSKFFHGLPIMIIQNDYEKDLFNGDIGIVVVDSEGTYWAIFENSGGWACHPLESLMKFELAFAMTVHKSQGSEYGNVLLILPADENHRLLTKEIIYTGITRAKRSLVIYGTASAVTNGISRKIVRESGIRNW